MPSDDTRMEVVAAVGLAVVLACGVIAIKNWDHIRCLLPTTPSIQWQGKGSPTPIEEQRL